MLKCKHTKSGLSDISSAINRLCGPPLGPWIPLSVKRGCRMNSTSKTFLVLLFCVERRPLHDGKINGKEYISCNIRTN